METLPDVYIYLLNLQFDLKRTASLPLKHGARGSCPFGLKWPIFQGKTWLVLGRVRQIGINLRKNELAKVRSTLESFIQVPFSKMAPN